MPEFNPRERLPIDFKPEPDERLKTILEKQRADDEKKRKQDEMRKTIHLSPEETAKLRGDIQRRVEDEQLRKKDHW